MRVNGPRLKNKIYKIYKIYKYTKKDRLKMSHQQDQLTKDIGVMSVKFVRKGI